MDSRRITHHGLAPPEGAAPRRCDIELVSERDEFAANGFGNQWFNTDITPLEGAFREASGLECLLNVEAIIRNVRNELG